MADLKMLFEKLDFTEVKTYVQSGNVIFNYRNVKPKEIEQMVQKQIKSEFGFDVSVFVFNIEKFRQIITDNPFTDDSTKETGFMYVTFMGNPPGKYNVEDIQNKKNGLEEIVITDNAAYLYCPHGYGRTKLNNNFLENKLHVSATTRNWKTCNEILKIARSFS